MTLVRTEVPGSINGPAEAGFVNLGTSIPDLPTVNFLPQRETAEKSALLNRLHDVLAAREATMRTADFYLKDGVMDYPKGFQEPPPFSLNAEQWELYAGRKAIVEQEQQRRESVRRRFMLRYANRSADSYIPQGATDLPFDFREPEPYVLDGKEWEIYSARRAKIT
jgi:hypothetical protein